MKLVGMNFRRKVSLEQLASLQMGMMAIRQLLAAAPSPSLSPDKVAIHVSQGIACPGSPISNTTFLYLKLYCIPYFDRLVNFIAYDTEFTE